MLQQDPFTCGNQERELGKGLSVSGVTYVQLKGSLILRNYCSRLHRTVAMEGHDLVLAELIRVGPLAAREKEDGGLTVLHLCVKYD